MTSTSVFKKCLPLLFDRTLGFTICMSKILVNDLFSLLELLMNSIILSSNYSIWPFRKLVLLLPCYIHKLSQLCCKKMCLHFSLLSWSKLATSTVSQIDDIAVKFSIFVGSHRVLIWLIVDYSCFVLVKLTWQIRMWQVLALSNIVAIKSSNSTLSSPSSAIFPKSNF